jgi:phosphoglycerol transferase MdoB-like AlkP superfamily enzyme
VTEHNSFSAGEQPEIEKTNGNQRNKIFHPRGKRYQSVSLIRKSFGRGIVHFLADRWSKAFHSRFGGLYLFGIVFLFVSFLLRTTLYIRTAASIPFSPVSLAKIYLVGFFFDLITWCYIVTPMALLLVFIPDRWFRSCWNRWVSVGLYFFTLYLMLFDVASEWFFWDEFGVRFNFIAVDYLVYTQEVVNNIWQSYPVPLVLGILFAVALVILLLTRKAYLRVFAVSSTLAQRARRGIVFVGVSVLSLLLVDLSLAEVSKNQYVNELAKNGFYSLFAAFRNNIIDYPQFYIAKNDQAMLHRLQELLQTGNTNTLSGDPSGILREVTYPGPEQHYNVIFLVIESLSAKYLGVFGNEQGLTPNLDALTQEGLLFRQFYATGTRTTRGLEAIALSLPPTPGRSLVKRPDNDHLFSIGPLFRQRGYEMKFLYGGRGFFDNMNHFFSGNGFGTIDQTNFQDEEITFHNAWGVCDGDLFRKTLKECDKSYAQDKPFLALVMSTSNHRPYTYPSVIDIPSGSGRNGAVKYTDYAIGAFIREARRRPWFDQTLFVIVADHCANSAGKTEVPVRNYHIPLILYAPKLIQPGTVDKLAGQIDLAPTLLGILHFSYRSKFFGRDILQPGPGRALLGNYQKMGLFTEGKVCLLLPKKKSHIYQVDSQGHQREIQQDKELLTDTISYYQSAAYLLKNKLYQAE